MNGAMYDLDRAHEDVEGAYGGLCRLNANQQGDYGTLRSGFSKTELKQLSQMERDIARMLDRLEAMRSNVAKRQRRRNTYKETR